MQYSKEDLNAFIRRIGPYPGRFEGRGIVISAGGPYLASAYLAVKSIRETGCVLPIQLWHIGPSELPDILRPCFERLGAVCIDSADIDKILPIKKLGGYQNKIFSVMHSPFREVLSVDADNILLRGPDFLFDDAGYRAHGHIFWPDFPFSEHNQWCIPAFAWDFFGLPPRRHAELETGQFLVNKEHSWRELSTVYHMNDESEFYYGRCSYGDKELHRFAWEYLGSRFNVIEKRPKLLEDMVRVQYAPDGGDLFLHSRKWVLPVGKNPVLPSYPMDGKCREWLEGFDSELKRVGIDFG